MPFVVAKRHALGMLILGGAGVVLCGCGQSEQITQYKVDKVAATPRAVDFETPSGDTRAWFFKVTGPEEQLESSAASFFDFVRSVRYEDGGPVWTLPEGWSETPGSEMRFATLRIGSDEPPLEVSVIPLPLNMADSQQYVVSNIDRWRGQVGLPTMTAEQRQSINQPAADLTSSDWEVSRAAKSERPTTLVRLRGKTPEIEQALVLGAIVMPSPTTTTTPRTISETAPRAASASPPARAPVASPLTYDVPEGWGPGRASTFRKASFSVQDGSEAVDISVSVAGGDDLANVNRWRGEIGLPPDLTEAQLSENSQTISVDGHSGLFVELTGEEEATLGVILRRDTEQWFFKLRGSRELALRERDNFEAFVKSFRFE